ncbi:hypothetical protein FRC03_002205, partial [Tulasnella sp. 419]
SLQSLNYQKRHLTLLQEKIADYVTSVDRQLNALHDDSVGGLGEYLRTLHLSLQQLSRTSASPSWLRECLSNLGLRGAQLLSPGGSSPETFAGCIFGLSLLPNLEELYLRSPLVNC